MSAVEVQTLPVRRITVRTSNSDETQAYVRASFGDHRSSFAVVGEAPSVSGAAAQVDGLNVTTMTMTDIAYRVLRPAQDDLLFWTQHAGRGDYRQGDESFRAAPGTVGLYRPGLPVRTTTPDGCQIRALTLLPSTVARVATEMGVDEGPVVFYSGHPINAELGDHWRQSMHFVIDRVLGGPAERMSTLVVAHLSHVAARAALIAFPNTTTTATHLRGPGRYLPSAIRRAIAYMDEHASEPLSLADVARAASLHPRTLEAGFARLNSTPMTYLRRVRLERAHQELLTADPTTGATVGAIAARWGFGHPGRFSALYRRTYGRPPSEVLKD